VATTGRAAGTPQDAPHDLAMLAHELRRRVAALRVVGESIGMLRAKGVDTTGMMDLLVGEIDELDALAREVLRERRPTEPASSGADTVAAVRAAARTVATARGDAPGGPGNAAGHGIGLFLVRRFLDDAGGRSWVTERQGGGTVVGLSLPLWRAGGDRLGDAVNT
jgi:hypothetical protein